MKSFDIRPVTINSALSWLRGEIHDSQLAPGADVIFWNELLKISAYRPAIAEVCRLADLGCKAMILHASNPIVWRKIESGGGVATMEEAIFWQGAQHTARRYLLPAAAFAAWLQKVRVKTADGKSKSL